MPTSQETGLAKWKSLSATEKEEYKANILLWDFLFTVFHRWQDFPGGQRSLRGREVRRMVSRWVAKKKLNFYLKSAHVIFPFSGIEEAQVKCETETGWV